MLFVASVYYGVAGPWYWHTFQASSFLDVYWGEEIDRAATYVVGSATLISLGVMLIRGGLKEVSGYKSLGLERFQASDSSHVFGIAFALFSGFGLLGVMYVGSFIVLGRDDYMTDPAFLIFYQFSDVCIPCLLILVATRGFTLNNMCLLGAYVGFCAVVGFRYKLVLLLFPLLVLLATFPSYVAAGGRLYASVAATLGLLFMALLTLGRQKMSGFDTDALKTVDAEAMWYGLFAESNVLFGLIGVLREAVDEGRTIGIVPLRDAFIDLIPKALYPQKAVGAYLAFPLEQLGSAAAITSSTAYPLVGELLLMSGTFAVIVGGLIWSGVYVTFTNVSRLSGRSDSLENVGLGLFAVLFGYYFLSRGFLPQAMKSVLFVAIPFVCLSRVWRGAGLSRAVL